MGCRDACHGDDAQNLAIQNACLYRQFIRIRSFAYSEFSNLLAVGKFVVQSTIRSTIPPIIPPITTIPIYDATPVAV